MTAKPTKRIYLSIPYESRHIAKAGRAKWDKGRKLWYTDEHSDLSLLKEWMPEEYLAELSNQEPAEEFGQAMRAIGFIVEGGHPLFDGKQHRIKVLGDQGQDTSGFYIGFMNDGHPGGYAMNNRSREELKWSAKRHHKYTPEQRELFNAQLAQRREEIRLQNENNQQIAAERVHNKLIKLKQIDKPTPYLLKKKIEITRDTYTDDEGLMTCIPHYDISRKIWSLTYILEDGTKRYTKDGKKHGCFHVINGFHHLHELSKIVIAEGYSTAATLSQALGYSAIVAFDSGNLMPVAETLHKAFPDRPIIIAGDDDRYVAKLYGSNPGRDKACEAAKAVNGRAVFPQFTPEEMQVESKEFTDWNDLANKSSLGINGFTKQIHEGF